MKLIIAGLLIFLSVERGEHADDMGVSVTYYQISTSDFNEIEEAILKNNPVDLEQYSIDELYVGKSFQGLQYVLAKGLGDELSNIFNGYETICSVDFTSEKFLNLPMEEQEQIFFNTQQEAIITSGKVKELVGLVEEVTQADINKWYDSEELNRNKVYPEVWHDDNSKNLAYNSTDLQESFHRWKQFINQVNKSDSFIIIR